MFDAMNVKNRIVDWIADFFRANASPDTKAVVGVSGGKDSSVVAALCVAALGKGRVLGVLMPQGEQFDIDVSYALCKTLGIQHVNVNIGESARALFDAVAAAGLGLNDVAKFNTPARLRMAALYAVSAVVGGRVANTCNLSEDWVGYSTKFGDSAGDFASIADLTVSEVKAVGAALGLSEQFIEKTPIDGLCGKTDEENLGFTYAALDGYIRENVCADGQVKEKIDRLHAINRHKVLPMPTFRLG